MIILKIDENDIEKGCSDVSPRGVRRAVRVARLGQPRPLPFSPFMSSTPFVNRAAWIWSAEGSHAVPAADGASPSHYQVRYFRRTFDVAEGAAAQLQVHVSADSRYLLYCNGRLVGRGPAKGDIVHHFYDTFDLGPELRAGRNAIAALVLDMSRVAHRSTASDRTPSTTLSVRPTCVPAPPS